MTEQELATAREANERCRRAAERLEDVRAQWKLQKDASGDDLFESVFRDALEDYRVAYVARAMLQGASRPVAEAAWAASKAGLDED
jgi:hypothetical protein